MWGYRKHRGDGKIQGDRGTQRIAGEIGGDKGRQGTQEKEGGTTYPLCTSVIRINIINSTYFESSYNFNQHTCELA